MSNEGFLSNEEEIVSQVSQIRSAGKTISLCHGVFDVLHVGHLEHLSEAARLSDVLLVSLTSDSKVKKGPGRPVFSALERAKMLLGLSMVDFVCLSDHETAVPIISIVKPDYFVKGIDYSEPKNDKSGNLQREIKAVERAGGLLLTTSSSKKSSSSLINQMDLAQSGELNKFVAEVKRDLGLDAATNWMSKVHKLKVLVVGEVIIDRYVFATALGKVSKDPILAFHNQRLETQAGGAVAIARHVSALGAETTLLSEVGDDQPGRWAKSHARSLNQISSHLVTNGEKKTIVKTRWVDEETQTKVFETYDMTIEAESTSTEDSEISSWIGTRFGDFDLVIVADYGNGMLGVAEIAAINNSRHPLLAVNTQSNAGNRGFNSPERYDSPAILCLNGSELQLELRRRTASLESLLPTLGEKLNCGKLFVTAGPAGIASWEHGSAVIHAPAFREGAIDPVGAGDAVLAIVSVLTALGVDRRISSLVANMAGAAQIQHFGTREGINLEQIRSAIENLFK